MLTLSLKKVLKEDEVRKYSQKIYTHQIRVPTSTHPVPEAGEDYFGEGRLSVDVTTFKSYGGKKQSLRVSGTLLP